MGLYFGESLGTLGYHSFFGDKSSDEGEESGDGSQQDDDGINVWYGGSG